MLLYMASTAQAAINASLDRYRISMGDTVRLTLSSDDDSDPSDADLSNLERSFDILQRSSSASTRIVNGERTQTRELNLELTPLREGSLVISPFVVGKQRSEALAVDVGPAPKSGTADEVVIFEAELDRQSVYVQGQLLLTLRVQQAVTLDSRSITELDLDNAYVETLGQNSFQRTIDGRPWLVHEIRYAIFPEASGELRIPAQTFSGRLGSGRRSLFDTRTSGRLIRRRTEDVLIQVKPRPAGFPSDATWLPASELSIEEQWSAPLDQLRIGDSRTRSITLTGTGLQGAQLPPVSSTDLQGLRTYPDQPAINNVNNERGIVGIRADSLALVAVRDGEYELPSVEIPWWDTDNDELRIARLPARRIRVLPAPLPPSESVPRQSQTAATAVAVSSVAETTAGPWPWIALLCGLGWLLTSLVWWRRGSASADGAVRPGAERAVSARGTERALLAACKRGDAQLARRELLAWVRTQGHDGSLEGWLRNNGNPSLREAIADLERCLYGDGSSNWEGGDLAAAIRSCGAASQSAHPKGALPPLYANP
ncbi:MAG: hypothetical protein ACI87W_002290 [Halieaceae bacterium]|jgi:hypothetical protein